jgi:hypothetical protein
MNIFTVSTIVPDPGGDNKQIFLYRAPSGSLGGGVRVLGGAAVNGATLGAGTSFSFQLLKYSSAATPVVNGTVCAAIGGTAATFWTSAVPQAFVIDAAHSFLDAGEWLVLDYQEDNAGNPTNCGLTIELAMGN